MFENYGWTEENVVIDDKKIGSHRERERDRERDIERQREKDIEREREKEKEGRYMQSSNQFGRSFQLVVLDVP